MHSHKKLGEFTPGVHLLMQKLVFFYHRYNTGLFVTYPAPILSIFEIKRRGVRMRKQLKNFLISAQEDLQLTGPKNK